MSRASSLVSDVAPSTPAEVAKSHGGLRMSEWRKASRSNASGNECVEAAALAEGRGVRDSKAPGNGHLTLSGRAFGELIARVKRDELDLSRRSGGLQ
ncbi:DUF397 domain-containing protein [Actinomadura meyerae]